MAEDYSISEATPLINNTDFADEEATGPRSARYGRAACLIMKLGCQTVKDFILSKLNLGSINIEQNLTQVIKSNEQQFKTLKLKRALTLSQEKILFPTTGLIQIQSIDLTLWILIGRTLVTDTTIPDWNKKKLCSYEIMPGHDIIRIREARNMLAHLNSPELSCQKFQSLWEEVSTALLRLGATQRCIDEHKIRDLDPETTKRCILEVQKQGLDEMKYVYMKDTQTKRCVKTAVIVMIIIAVTSVICIVVPMATFLQAQKICSDYKVQIPSDMVMMYEIPREGWRAKPPKTKPGFLPTPVPYVIFSDTGRVGACMSTDECCRNMREIQDLNMNNGLNDGKYTYVFGNEGTIFEGRGFHPNQLPGWEQTSLYLAFMGEFFSGKPTEAAFDAAYYFLLHLRDQGTLAHNFTIYGVCQLRPHYPCSPGPEVYAVIKQWKDPEGSWGWRPYNHDNGSDCATKCTNIQ